MGFNFGETYQEPVLIENEVLASAISRREVLDPESGSLLLSENVLVTPDGQEQVRKRWTYESVERVDQPPEQVLELFGQDFSGYQPAAPLGTPPPPGFDPAQSALRLHSIPGDDFNLPTFWYGDIYAGDYLLGRVDFGGSPGGYCDRSADGSKLAFNKVVFAGENEAHEYLRWLDLRDVSQVYDPAPELELVSKVAWAPQGARLAFSACRVGKDGLRLVPAGHGNQRGAPALYSRGWRAGAPLETGWHAARLYPFGCGSRLYFVRDRRCKWEYSLQWQI